jgi:HEAT repeat protein
MPALIAQAGKTPQPADKDIDSSLAELLEAEDGEARPLAVVALAALGGEHPVAAPKQVLQDEESWIREAAVEALAEIGGEQAIQGLQQALNDEDEDVRKAAQEALIRLQPDPQEHRLPYQP